MVRDMLTIRCQKAVSPTEFDLGVTQVRCLSPNLSGLTVICHQHTKLVAQVDAHRKVFDEVVIELTGDG